MKSANSAKESSKPASKAAKPKRIVVVDDHPLFRKGLEQLINSSDDAFNIWQTGKFGEHLASSI